MKKTIALILALVLCLSLMTACGAKKEEAAKTFTVGFDAEYPPYGYMDENGEYTGFDLELAAAVCELKGWELVKKPINWDSKDMELDTGAIDCVWNGFTVTGREDDYTWSDPYVDNSIVWIVKADSGIETAADLAGKVVITQSGSSAETALTAEEDNEANLALAATFADLQFAPDYNTCFANLDSGLVQAIAVDIGVANYQLKSRSDNSLKMLAEPLSTEQYAIGFKKGNTELRDEVMAALNEVVKSGKFMELAEKYELTDMVILGK